ncbi:MAG: hypothetical protein ACOH5I_21340 [Oligoflexus sp.]
MSRFKLVLNLSLIATLSVACGGENEDSDLNASLFSCPNLNLIGEPAVSQQANTTTISIEVQGASSLFACRFAAVSEDSGQVQQLALGREDIFHQSANSKKIQFQTFSSNLSDLSKVRLVSYEGFQIKQVLWSGSKSASPDQGQAPQQPSPNTPAPGGNQVVKCAFNINGVLYEGNSQAECDQLRAQLGINVGQTPTLPTTPKQPTLATPPANGEQNVVRCAFNINGVLYEGNSQAECDQLRRDLGL